MKKEIDLIIDKMKSSVRNKYCLFCRTEITEENHHCSQIENAGNKILKISLELGLSKEIINEFKDESLLNEEFAQNIKNKLIAYNI